MRKLGIQISEHNLSPEAKEALNNAKNKSQFLRDAIEFYVRRGEQNKDIEKDIREIKDLLKDLAYTGGISITKSEKEDKSEIIDRTIVKSIDTERVLTAIDDNSDRNKENSNLEDDDIPECYR